MRATLTKVLTKEAFERMIPMAAELLMADATRVIYRFDLTCDTNPVLSGRAAVVLDAGPSE